jgi:hypothetical protein
MPETQTDLEDILREKMRMPRRTSGRDADLPRFEERMTEAMELEPQEYPSMIQMDLLEDRIRESLHFKPKVKSNEKSTSS